MSLLTHLLSVIVATNPPSLAVSNEIQSSTGISVTVPDANDPVKQELDKVMIADDDAQFRSGSGLFVEQYLQQPAADLAGGSGNYDHASSLGTAGHGVQYPSRTLIP